MGKIKNILVENFDLYGRQNFITFKKKQEYKSLFGLFVSILYLLLFFNYYNILFNFTFFKKPIYNNNNIRNQSKRNNFFK